MAFGCVCETGTLTLTVLSWFFKIISYDPTHPTLDIKKPGKHCLVLNFSEIHFRDE